MLTNGQEVMASRQNVPSQGHQTNTPGGARSQDDAMVAYLFQRPSNEVGQYTTKRWAVGDDSVIEQVCFYDQSASELFVSFRALWCKTNMNLLYLILCAYIRASKWTKEKVVSY